MIPIAAVKLATGIVVSSCTGSVVKGVIRNNIVATTRLQKVQVFVGTAALAGLAGNAAAKAVDENIDQVAEIVAGLKDITESQ